MGDEESGAPEGNHSRDVYRSRLDLGEYHRDWLFNLKLRASNGRSIPFHSPELEKAVSPLADGKIVLMQGVILRPGEVVPTHPHAATDVCLYMPMSHPSSLRFENPDIEFPTEEGYVVVIPKGQWHSVELNETQIDRLTIATLFR